MKTTLKRKDVAKIAKKYGKDTEYLMHRISELESEGEYITLDELDDFCSKGVF